MNPELRKESLLVIARSRDAAAGALNFIETNGRWPRRVLGDPPTESEMEAVELDALKLQRQFALRTLRKRNQRQGTTVQGITILPSDLPRLMLAVLSGRQTVKWRDRKAGYLEINPTEALGAVLAEQEAQYDDEAAQWAAIDAAATKDELPARPEPPRRPKVKAKGDGRTATD
jgi:hypothetical protein